MSLSQRSRPAVSVLIRVRNEEAALRRLLKCLSTQELDRPFEVIVIDNDSDDESAGVARDMGARVFSLPKSLFGYGRAINAGVRLCRGELVVLLSAHSWPLGDDWLSRMVGAIEGGTVAAAFCRQVSDGKVCPEEQARFEQFGERSYELGRDELLRRYQAGEDVYDVCAFSNSATIVRCEVALRHPFRALPFAEDRAFALDCVLAGNTIAYLATASVAYRQPANFTNFYRIGRAGTIARHLIRKLGSDAIGIDPRPSEPGWKAVRRLYTPLVVLGRTIEVLLHDRSQLGRAIHYAALRGTTMLGIIVGELTWHRHRDASGFDSSVLLLADNGLSLIVPEDVA
jgi:glycosyltransferase involved in cell wall biosynthesis